MNIADKLKTIVGNEQKVYDAGQKSGYDNGFSKGFDDGYKNGEEFGKKAQYDYFWDNFQENGERTDYSYAFCNWDKFEQCFKPKYDIKPTGSIQEMFKNSRQYVSLPAICEAAGIVLDFAGVTNFNQFLSGTAFYRVGIIDCSSATSLNLAFNNASSLTTIDKLIVHERITSYTDCFANSVMLNNITIEGTIAGTGFNVQNHTKLTHDSLMSIINALKDYSGTTTTKTITLGAANLAKLTDAEKVVATQKGWTLA